MEDKISIQKGDKPETTIVTITKEVVNTVTLAMLQQQSERIEQQIQQAGQQMQVLGEQKAQVDSLIEKVIAEQPEVIAEKK